MTRFPCPYLKAEVELTEEWERHIAERHPDLLPEHRERVAEVLADPDQIRKSVRFGRARLCHWIITAYITVKLVGGEVEWKRS